MSLVASEVIRMCNEMRKKEGYQDLRVTTDTHAAQYTDEGTEGEFISLFFFAVWICNASARSSISLRGGGG